MTKIMEDINSRLELTMAEKNTLNLNKIDNMYNELEEIEKNIEKYNMKWAFEYAHKEIENTFETEICSRFTKKLVKEEPDSIKAEINTSLHSLAKTIAKSTKTFNHAQNITDIGEIIASFIVIISIHELTSLFVKQYSSLVSASLIVVIFALFKIFIEKRIVSKLLRKREVRIYRNTLNRSKKAFVRLFIFYIQVGRFDEENSKVEGKTRLANALKFIKKTHQHI